MISRFPHGMIFIWLIKAICNFRLHRFPEEPCSACICGTTTILAKLYDRRSSLTWCSAFDRRARALWPTKLEMWLGKSLGNRYHICIEEAGLVGIKNGPGIFCALAKFAGVIFSGSFQHVTIIVKIPNFGLWTGNRALLHCKRTGKLRLRALENRTGTDQVHVPLHSWRCTQCSRSAYMELASVQDCSCPAAANTLLMLMQCADWWRAESILDLIERILRSSMGSILEAHSRAPIEIIIITR